MITLLLLTAGISYVVVSYKTPPTMDISTLHDLTDKLLVQPKANDLLNLYDFTGENKWNGASFRFSNLTDVSYNHASAVHIDKAHNWLSNEPEREKTILKFQNEVSNIVAQSTKDSIGKEHSAIYLPIAMELERLSYSKAEKRILIIYSDLMENDLDLTLYSKNELQLLKTNPDSLKEVFEKRKTLPSLVGIDVYLIYQPEDAEADGEYRIISAFYRRMLEEKGAMVHIAANL